MDKAKTLMQVFKYSDYSFKSNTNRYYRLMHLRGSGCCGTYTIMSEDCFDIDGEQMSFKQPFDEPCTC